VPENGKALLQNNPMHKTGKQGIVAVNNTIYDIFQLFRVLYDKFLERKQFNYHPTNEEKLSLLEIA
jgi:hypothetical protein